MIKKAIIIFLIASVCSAETVRDFAVNQAYIRSRFFNAGKAKHLAFTVIEDCTLKVTINPGKRPFSITVNVKNSYGIWSIDTHTIPVERFADENGNAFSADTMAIRCIRIEHDGKYFDFKEWK